MTVRAAVLGWAMAIASVAPLRAEIDICTPITALPAVISSPGVYCLQSDLSTSATTGVAIDIQASDVILDLNGFTLDGLAGGAATWTDGIYADNRHNVTVRNGTVSGFEYGVYLMGVDDALSSRNVLEDLRVDRNRLYGLMIRSGSNHIIRNNHVVNHGENDTTDFAFGITVEHVSNTLIEGNVVVGTSETASVTPGGTQVAAGINIFASSVVVLRGNSVIDTDVLMGTSNGISIVSDSSDVMVLGNHVLNPTGVGAAGVNVGSTALDIVCIGNTIAGYAVAENGCAFTADNHLP